MKNLPWDLYAQFLDVARLGGLSGASRATGLSPATLGRKMLDLEAQVGRSLFLRSRTGYELTPDGHALMSHCLDMEAAARGIASWVSERDRPPQVRLSCGTWMARFLMAGLPQSLVETCRLDFVIGERRANLSHRQSDVGIRAFEPQEPNLATAMLGEVAYAMYRARAVDGGEALPLIAIREEEALSAYLRYPYEEGAERIGITVSRASSLLDGVKAGAGIAVLPCFVGDAEPDLVRYGDELPELRHRQWIVMNNEDRHRREIRAVVDRATGLIRNSADLFAGQRGRAARQGEG